MKYIAIEGSIGVGKTTLLNLLKNIYSKAKIIPEFIESKEGKEMLEAYINKEISSFCFQNYILDYWNKIINSIYNTNDLVISERLPEAMKLFISVNEGLSLTEHSLLFQKLYDINEKYHFHNFELIRIPSNYELSELIHKINNSKSDRIKIFIEAPNISEQINRIIKRNRECEKKIYN